MRACLCWQWIGHILPSPLFLRTNCIFLLLGKGPRLHGNQDPSCLGRFAVSWDYNSLASRGQQRTSNDRQDLSEQASRIPTVLLKTIPDALPVAPALCLTKLSAALLGLSDQFVIWKRAFSLKYFLILFLQIHTICMHTVIHTHIHTYPTH